MRKTIVCAIFCALLYAGIAAGCSQQKYHPVYFNANEYIFIGKVTGYAGPLESEDINGTVHGLSVDIDKVVYAPEKLHQRYILFVYDVNAGCRPTGISQRWLSQLYPVGSEIRVVAQKAVFFPPDSLSDDIYLEAWFGNSGSVSLNLKYKSLRSTEKNKFNYLKYIEKYDEMQTRFKAEKPRLEYVTWWNSYKNQIDFEFRKDLWRLEKEKSNKKRVKLLKRIVCNPYIRQQSIEEMVSRYVSDEKAVKKLKQMREKANHKLEAVQGQL